MDEYEYKEAVRDALLQKISGLRSTMSESGLIGNTFMETNLISNIKAHVHHLARGIVPENNNILFKEVIETLEREKIVVMQRDDSLLIL